MKTLSDKEITSGGSPAYNAEDVKEFIKKLKDKIELRNEVDPQFVEITNDVIDKLAGDKLI